MPTLRPGLDSDGDGIAALIAAVFAEYPGCPFVRDEFPELAQPARHYAAKGGGLWVLEANGAVVGCFAISRVDGTDIFEIHKVYLARSLRGFGHAGRLWDAAIGEAARRGATALRLWTDTRFDSGHRFYEKRGFRRLPVTRFLADATNAWEYAYVLAPLP
ncbi:GNAT family N-acetyltransferase [Chthonobacter albigriseus]|uniref:GNAT family N-acetyltransferase n=1 Tax=Chthonobacter albigriseus TaxID=1683161 RepID=UPI0015EEA597|nr:GNAT family N-acetyltransferase [Chthonobacter albigriseus]